jgi:hypothetical protein
MDPSAGSHPNPTGPRHRTSAKAMPAWPGAASSLTGVPPHCAALPRATSVNCPNTRSSGSYEPLRNNDNNTALTLSPLLLSIQEDAGDTPPTGDALALSSSVSADGAANVGATGSASPTDTAAGDSPFITHLEMSAFSNVLLTVTTRIEVVSSRMEVVSSWMETLDLGLEAVSSRMAAVSSRMETLDLAIRSLHKEVRSNHGHVTKRLIMPLEARVAALEGTTVRLEDDLAAKGTALLNTVEELNGTAASLTTAVNHTTRDFGSWLSALEASNLGRPSAAPVSHALRDLPPSEIPLVSLSPPPVDANTNSRVAWACVHNRVTPPRIPSYACHQGPELRQTTLPRAFHPRRSPTRNKEDSVTGAAGPANFAPSPTQAHPTPPMAFPAVADTSGIVGGPITSPQNWDKETQVQSLGASRFNVLRLACPAYHGGNDGAPALTEEFIQQCGFTCIKASAEDVVVCYNNIMYVHQKVRELWYNKSLNTLGPQMDRILQKSLSVFPRLTLTDTSKVIFVL